jgi:hypothetical protein
MDKPNPIIKKTNTLRPPSPNKGSVSERMIIKKNLKKWLKDKRVILCPEGIEITITKIIAN